MAVHVRLERRHRVDLDHGHAAARALGVAGEALSDPAVADDAELLAGAGEVGQPEDRRQRRLAGAVAVVVQVLRPRVVRRDRRERELPRALERPQPRDARRRLLRDAEEARDELGPPLDDPPVSSAPSSTTISGSKSAAASRSPTNSSGLAPRVRAPRSRARRGPPRPRPASSPGSSRLRRPPRPPRRAASRGTPSSPPGGRRPRPASRERAVREPRPGKPVEHRGVPRDPRDQLLARGREARVGDARAVGDAGGHLRRSRIPARRLGDIEVGAFPR